MDQARLAPLISYVAEARKHYLTYDQIREQLLSSGWSDVDVNEYLPSAWQQSETRPAATRPPVAQPPIVSPSPTPSPYPGPAPRKYGGAATTNNSGSDGPVPPDVEAMGWSWGAFGITWIWGIGNQVYIALLALIPFVNLVVSIYLGVVGHKLAWQKRRFASLQQYQETMRAWNAWGLGVFIFSVVINIAWIIAKGRLAGPHVFMH